MNFHLTFSHFFPSLKWFSWLKNKKEEKIQIHSEGFTNFCQLLKSGLFGSLFCFGEKGIEGSRCDSWKSASLLNRWVMHVCEYTSRILLSQTYTPNQTSSAEIPHGPSWTISSEILYLHDLDFDNSHICQQLEKGVRTASVERNV